MNDKRKTQKPYGGFGLTRLKIDKAMSEETLCFNAIVTLDDMKIMEVVNRGHGGAHEYRALRSKTDSEAGRNRDRLRFGLDKLRAYAASLPMIDINDTLDAPAPKGSPVMVQPDEDCVINDLITVEEARRWVKRTHTQRTYYQKKDGGIHGLPVKINDALRSNLRDTYRDVVILNDLPFDEAFALMTARTG